VATNYNVKCLYVYVSRVKSLCVEYTFTHIIIHVFSIFYVFHYFCVYMSWKRASLNMFGGTKRSVVSPRDDATQ